MINLHYLPSSSVRKKKRDGLWSDVLLGSNLRILYAYEIFKTRKWFADSSGVMLSSHWIMHLYSIHIWAASAALQDSQVFQRTSFTSKCMDWILNSHHVWMIQTADTLLLDCKQNVRGSMGAICKSSIPACVLEWVGQWSVTPRHITERLPLSVSSSFII